LDILLFHGDPSGIYYREMQHKTNQTKNSNQIESNHHVANQPQSNHNMVYSQNHRTIFLFTATTPPMGKMFSKRKNSDDSMQGSNPMTERITPLTEAEKAYLQHPGTTNPPRDTALHTGNSTP
jgi:hypothetical protein